MLLYTWTPNTPSFMWVCGITYGSAIHAQQNTAAFPSVHTFTWALYCSDGYKNCNELEVPTSVQLRLDFKIKPQKEIKKR